MISVAFTWEYVAFVSGDCRQIKAWAEPGFSIGRGRVFTRLQTDAKIWPKPLYNLGRLWGAIALDPPLVKSLDTRV